MLIKAALCEDNLHDQREASRLLQRWADLAGHELQLSVFADSTKLIGAIDEAFHSFDVYLLDIEMNKPQEGLDLSRIIRRHSDTIPIIFLSSHHELTYAGYDVQALHFLVKPIDEDRFHKTMDRVSAILEHQRTSLFLCTIEGNLVRYPFSELLYLRTDGHYLLLNGDIALRFRAKLSEAAEQYAEHFVICHQSYAVNIEHVRSLSMTEARLSDGSLIPISQKRLAAVRQRFAATFGIDRGKA